MMWYWWCTGGGVIVKGWCDTGDEYHPHNVFLLVIRGSDYTVVGFTTICAMSAYHHYSCEFEPRSWRGVLDTTWRDKVCQWLATGQRFFSGTDDISEILLKDAPYRK
jgi:hypothetical protein